MSLFVRLAEPILYLQGFEQDGESRHAPAILRGSVVLRITKSTKLRSISLTFIGRARTEWPEGIPPKKVEDHEEEILVIHTWPFFHAQWAASTTNADSVRLFKPSDDFKSLDNTAPPRTNPHKSRDLKRASVQFGITSLHSALPSHALSGGEHDRTAQNSGHLVFQPGEYAYNFEYPVDTRMPESCLLDLGSVKYGLEVAVERAGAWTSNLRATRDVELVRYPSDPSLEQVEPIAISRTWEDQLLYEVVISGKTFSLGSQIPIAIKLTPLAKVQIHRIRVVIIENVEYSALDRRVHRTEPPKTIQLLEKSASSPMTSSYEGSTIRILSGGGVNYDHREAAARGQEVPSATSNLLGNLAEQHNLGPTEMELNAQLPDCNALIRLHPATNFRSVQVNHWIKILLRISRQDATYPQRRRHFEISIDSPISILSCRATPQNLALPAYGEAHTEDLQRDCACRVHAPRPAAPRRGSSAPKTSNAIARTISATMTLPSVMSSSSGSTRPRATTVIPSRTQPPPPMARPIHLLRNPSPGPPAWDDEDPPPQPATPPPGYEQSVDGHGGLADYFSRLADEDGEDDRLR